MNNKDKQQYITRYTERYNQHGISPATLGWGKGGRQKLRFSILTQIAKLNQESILDVGCGFADLYHYLIENSWSGQYTGVDIVPILIEVAHEKYPYIDLMVCDLLEEDFNLSFDYVVCSGVFNAKLYHESNEEYILKMLKKLWKICKKGIACDFMTSAVDFQNAGAFHLSPSQAVEFALQLTRRFTIRHDYMPYEFCIYLYKDQDITISSTYQNFV